MKKKSKIKRTTKQKSRKSKTTIPKPGTKAFKKLLKDLDLMQDVPLFLKSIPVYGFTTTHTCVPSACSGGHSGTLGVPCC